MHPFSIESITKEDWKRQTSPSGISDMTLYGQPSPGTDTVNNDSSSPSETVNNDPSSPSETVALRSASQFCPESTDEMNNNNNDTENIAETHLCLDKYVNNSTDNNSNDSKPEHSYIALISMAILSSPSKKLLLGDIYQYVMDNFPYYNNKDKAWRNSIRHNLSLNECFIKCGRADNGKGNFWSIHPACIDDFSKGDFRRRQARRRARKCMKDFGVSDLPLGYRCNIGYVPMSSSLIGYAPYQGHSLYYQSASPFACPLPRQPSQSARLHPSTFIQRQPLPTTLSQQTAFSNSAFQSTLQGW
ncbi:hypothetical protein CHS0354_040253 [Potamilus streckersoni]|uniref:Fork-head domain-containing protein n=1 Tax=Potamilus streckersoni TaxID=2493646 RepID=A0AAE0S4M8_9BIVA|nr:hypothetical protein CHS0354_040253 [Potamilus streckersoni]